MWNDNACLLRNTDSGGGQDRPDLDRWILAHPEVRIVDIEDGVDVIDAATRAARECDLLIVAGGDGTVSAGVNGVMRLPPEERPELAFVPAGTANDLCGTLGLCDIETALLAVESGNLVRVDAVLAEAGGREFYFVNAALGGFPALVARRITVDEKGLWGRAAYLKKGAEVLSEAEAHEVELVVDGREQTTRVATLVVANGRTLGGIASVAPDADPGDGLLRVVLSTSTELSEFLGDGWRMLRGDLDDNERTRSFDASIVEVRSEGIPFNLDGEPLLESPVRFRVVSQALRVRTPSESA